MKQRPIDISGRVLDEVSESSSSSSSSEDAPTPKKTPVKKKV